MGCGSDTIATSEAKLNLVFKNYVKDTRLADVKNLYIKALSKRVM